MFNSPTDLIVIDMSLAYNTILERSLLHQTNVFINTKYLTLKFPTYKGVDMIWGNQTSSRQYAFFMFKGQEGLGSGLIRS